MCLALAHCWGGGGGVPGTKCFGYRVPSALDTGCMAISSFFPVFTE